jgi:hypothetical protein
VRGAEDRLRAFAKDQAGRAMVAAALKRKQAALNVLVRDSVDKWLDAKVAKGVPLHEAIAGYLTFGTNARDGINRYRWALENSYHDLMLRDIERAVPHVTAMMKDPKASKAFFDDVVKEMRELRPDGTPGLTKNKDAQATADILRKYAETSRIDANKAGANIGELNGWAPQAHDVGKMLKGDRATRIQRWIDHVFPLLDVRRTFGPGTSEAEARGLLREMYLDIVTGRDRGAAVPPGEELKGPANLARSMEKHRVLHFNDADSHIKYNDTYGRGNVMLGMMDHQHMMARKVALMEKLGPNPEAMLTGILKDRIAREGATAAGREDESAAAIRGLTLEGGPIGKAWAAASGIANSPVNVDWARRMAGVRAWMGMGKLGSMVFSHFSLLGNMADVMAFHGQSRTGANLGGALRAFAKGGGKEERQFATGLGVAMDGMTRDLFARAGMADGTPGWMAKGATAFFKLTGFHWFLEKAETGLAHAHSWWMAEMAAHDHASLPEAYRHVLGLHGFGADHWQAIRQAVDHDAEGRHYVSPDKVASIGDEHFEPMVKGRVAAYADSLRGKDGSLTDEARAKVDAFHADRLAAERRDLELDLRGFFADETAFGVAKADDRTKAFMTQGTRPGTVPGEIARFIGQFHQFTVTNQQRTMDRALRGYAGADPAAGKWKQRLLTGPTQNFPAVASLIAATTAWGLVGAAAKDIVKNRTPKPLNQPSTWGAALLQGGGLGIYGDFLFGEYNRMGGGVASTLLGPTIGTGASLIELWQKARAGAVDYATTGKESDVRSADFLKFAVDNAPFVNLWFLRSAIDLAVLNRLQEYLSPGTFQRRQANMKKSTGNRYLFSPLPHGVSP